MSEGIGVAGNGGGMVSVPRELLEQYLGIKKGDWVEAGHELRAILAQPVADEQAEQQPVAFGLMNAGRFVAAELEKYDVITGYEWVDLYAAPIAQTVAQHVMEENEKLRGLLREAVHCCPDEQLRNEMKAALSQQTVPSQPEQSGLAEALRDLSWAVRRSPSCQDDIVSRCRCMRCALVRADAALSDQGGGQ